MKRLLVIPALLTVALAVPVAVAAPAFAKGATSVTVTGPGIKQLTVDHWTRPRDDVDLGTLSEVSGIYGIFGDGDFTDAPGLTGAELGPRYILTWYQASDVMAVSHVYPFAEGGAWAYVPHEQRSWGTQLKGGWWHGGAALEGAMARLGVAAPVAADTPGSKDSSAKDATDEPAAAAAITPDTPSSGTSAVPTGVIAALAALLLGAGAWLVRRRRTPQPIITLSEPA